MINSDNESISNGSEPSTPGHNIRVTQQYLTRELESTSADVALEPPDSGDYYESFAIPDGSGDVGVFVGDVTGHGASASVKAQAIRSEAISHLKAGDSPLETVEAANSVHVGEDDRFSTLFVAKIHADTGQMEYANAGHEPPMIAHDNGTIDSLETTGPPLGAVPSNSDFFEQKSTTIPNGGTLMITTDGVTEARRAKSSRPDFFGHDRLRNLLCRLRRFSPATIVKTVLQQVLLFTRSVITDDIVVMAIRRNKSVAPKRPL